MVTASSPFARRSHLPARLVRFLLFLTALIVCFSWPLSSLFSYALHSDLHSHIVLIPFISAYLLYVHWDKLPEPRNSSIGWATFPFLCGLALVVSNFAQETFEPAVIALAFICFVVAGGFFFLGKDWMKAAIFPFAFLLFMVPLPDSVANSLENASKLASAECANFFLQLTNVPVLREGTIFQLPNITIEVAQECSGIRSSWVLLIASTLASYLFLKAQFQPSNPCARGDSVRSSAQWFSNRYHRTPLRQPGSAHDSQPNPPTGRTVIFRALAFPTIFTSLVSPPSRATPTS